jgi:hypothetical protein
MNKSTLWAVIVVLITVIIWMTKCSNHSTITGRIDTVTDTSYIHDTLKIKGKTKIKPVPVPFYVHDTVIDSTGNITIVEVKKYATNDTFIYDTDSVKVTVYTKIYSSSPLDSISSELKAIIRHKIIERVITKEIIRKNAFFAGPSIGLGKTSYISLDGLYERNGKIIYKLGAGVNTNLQPMLKAGIYWQISK